MATYTKFNQFVEDLCKGVHNLATGTLKIMLTLTAPVATNSVKADLTEIAAGNGYTAGGTAITATLTNGTACGGGSASNDKLTFSVANLGCIDMGRTDFVGAGNATLNS